MATAQRDSTASVAAITGSGEMRDEADMTHTARNNGTVRKYIPGTRVTGRQGTVTITDVGTLPIRTLLDCGQCHVQPLLSSDSVTVTVRCNGMSLKRRVCSDRCVTAFVHESVAVMS